MKKVTMLVWYWLETLSINPVNILEVKLRCTQVKMNPIKDLQYLVGNVNSDQFPNKFDLFNYLITKSNKI